MAITVSPVTSGIYPAMLHRSDHSLNFNHNVTFSAWKRSTHMESHRLSPVLIAASGGQREVPFGVAVVRTAEACLASECCEELWTILK